MFHVGDVRSYVSWCDAPLFQLSQPSITQLQAVNYMCFSAHFQSVSDISNTIRSQLRRSDFFVFPVCKTNMPLWE